MKHAAELFKIWDEGERDMLAIGTCQGPSIPPLRWTVCCVTHLHRDHQNHVRSPVRCLRGHRPAERRTPAHPDSDMRFPIPHAVEWLATATTKNPWPGAFFSLARVGCLSTIVQCCARKVMFEPAGRTVPPDHITKTIRLFVPPVAPTSCSLLVTPIIIRQRRSAGVVRRGTERGRRE